MPIKLPTALKPFKDTLNRVVSSTLSVVAGLLQRMSERPTFEKRQFPSFLDDISHVDPRDKTPPSP